MTSSSCSITRLVAPATTLRPRQAESCQRRRRFHGAVSAEALPRRRAQHQNNWFADHHRNGNGRNQFDRRHRHLRRVQGHQQRRAQTRPQDCRTARIPTVDVNPSAHVRTSCCCPPTSSPSSTSCAGCYPAWIRIRQSTCLMSQLRKTKTNYEFLVPGVEDGARLHQFRLAARNNRLRRRVLGWWRPTWHTGPPDHLGTGSRLVRIRKSGIDQPDDPATDQR